MTNRLETAAQQAAEPVAWISEVRCVGPEYGKKLEGCDQRLSGGDGGHDFICNSDAMTLSVIKININQLYGG